MPAFTNEINYRPMVLALLQMPEVQISQLAALKSAPQQDGENRPIPLSFEGVCIWRLPEAAGFFGCEPVPKPDTQLLGTFHTSNASSELRTEQASVCGFIREPPYSGESTIDRPPRKLSILKEYAIAGYSNPVERKSWLGAVPLNELINGVPISTFGLGLPKAVQDRRFAVIQTRKTEFSLGTLWFWVFALVVSAHSSRLHRGWPEPTHARWRVGRFPST